MQRQDAYITLEPLCAQKSYAFAVLISDHLDNFLKKFQEFSRKNQEFCEHVHKFSFFSKKMRRTFHAVFMQFMRFVCGFQTAYKLYAVFMRFEANCIQFGPNCIQFICSLETAYKPHINCIKTAWKVRLIFWKKNEIL